MTRKTVLIAGAHGLIGRTLIEQVESDADADIIGLGRHVARLSERIAAH